MYLLDTNVISELRKGALADAGVLAFFAALDAQHIHLAVQTMGELRRGLENIRGRGDHAQAARLEYWLDDVTTGYADRILDFDLDCAQVWGKLMSPNPQHPIDKQIAAIALIHDLTVVTRNTPDFAATGVKLLNPFAG
ncbi:MAG: type II toxin-antitoxin system VapC family toxin [Methyloversatilis sp.]|jgi:predicted nucleic acid-binding protein|nr:type II toxin-antitoxin system VapC family toxin [Methyloversatilis sp.]